ncbi:unnamed protein product [Mytilus coruscus]|uniref:G-protein coupled receptors family 1 profile domain-containing protein n=1 Tax=Mytilus coruscus TaxID=42192 RepID=A0A6J8EGC2_MYTCO|nr:unnamed protein product [Mytilus coruscus]
MPMIKPQDIFSAPGSVSFHVDNISGVSFYADDVTVHPLGNTGLSFVLHDTNDLFIIKIINRNCSGVDIDFSNIYEVLENEKCKKNVHISKLFDDVNDTRSVTFEDSGIIPLFEDIGITFVDKQCIEDFKLFLSIEGSVKIGNEEIHYFLKNWTDCIRWVTLANEHLFRVNVYEEKGLSKIGITSLGESTVMLSFEDDKCVDNFIEFVTLYGYIDIEYEDFLVSPSNINEFHRKHKCLDFRIPCFGERYDVNFLYLPPKPAAFAGSVLSIVIIVINTYVMFVFLQKKNRSPIVIMLSAIALNDMLTAVFVCTPMTMPYLLYDRQVTFYSYDKSWVWLSYDYLTFTLWTVLSFEISNIFHMASIFNTTALCVQRAVSMLFPIWNKIHMTNKVCVYTSIVMFGYSLLLNIALIICHMNLSLNIDGILCVDYERLDILKIESYTILVVNISYIFSCILMIVCSLYIACKLTILRKNLKWVDSQEVQKRNRRSAFIVVIISIICTLSEVISIMTLTFTFATTEQVDKFYEGFFYMLYPYQQLSITIGFFCNFFAYLFMGTQLRDTIYESFKRVMPKL